MQRTERSGVSRPSQTQRLDAQDHVSLNALKLGFKAQIPMLASFKVLLKLPDLSVPWFILIPLRRGCADSDWHIVS